MEKNILKYLEKQSKKIGIFEQNNFEMDVYLDCNYRNIESPIEQLFYIALKTIQKLNYIDDFNDVKYDNNKNETIVNGLYIEPQKKISNYRVDFYLEYKRKKLIVECDSQKFHERNEKERRYEKERDRILIKSGYKIFHFTGSEIFKNSLIVAKEILEYLIDDKNLVIDNNNDNYIIEEEDK